MKYYEERAKARLADEDHNGDVAYAIKTSAVQAGIFLQLFAISVTTS